MLSIDEEAWKRMPACLVGAIDQDDKTIDLLSAARHEIDMYDENQDGHLTDEEIRQVRKFLVWLESI